MDVSAAVELLVVDGLDDCAGFNEPALNDGVIPDCHAPM